MATEEPPKLDGLTALIEIIFILLLVGAVLNRLPLLIEEKTGINIFDISGSYARLALVGPETPLGSAVKLVRGIDIMSTPGFGRLLGFQKEGSTGLLSAGPEDVGGKWWWFVDFSNDPDGWVESSALSKERTGLVSAWVKTSFFVISAIFILGGFGIVMYLTIRINQIRAREVQAIRAAIASAENENAAKDDGKNPRWLLVLTHIDSENPNDWRQAIIEADIMLDELITRMGYRGESLGEKMKQIEKSDFTTIELAWEAHKVRNQIAHAGSDFIVTKRTAARAIDCYRQVFEEFYYI